MVGGYSQDHPLLLTADIGCRIMGQIDDGSGHHLLRHNCAATRGVSGAPLLARDGTDWLVVGVVVAAEKGAPGGFAVTLGEISKQLESDSRRPRH
jgi:protease YdgD